MDTDAYAVFQLSRLSTGFEIAYLLKPRIRRSLLDCSFQIELALDSSWGFSAAAGYRILWNSFLIMKRHHQSLSTDVGRFVSCYWFWSLGNISVFSSSNLCWCRLCLSLGRSLKDYSRTRWRSWQREMLAFLCSQNALISGFLGHYWAVIFEIDSVLTEMKTANRPSFWKMYTTAQNHRAQITWSLTMMTDPPNYFVRFVNL